MTPSLRNKLQLLHAKYQQLGEQLLDPQLNNDIEQLKNLSKEHADLRETAEYWQSFLTLEQRAEENQELIASEDAELAELAAEEQQALQQQMDDCQRQLYALLIPKDRHDENNIFLEIRAGTGGNEAALFCGDLYNMYWRYAEKQRWKIEVLNISEGEVGGYKELILRVVGKRVYSKLKFESGAHRVQRVPATESQGRVHTSACTVAVMPEVEADDTIELNPTDLRIDTFRASGAGGQHVNKTDSAIRITHLPSGIAVECQEGRSQHQNKAKAMAMLHARLLDQQLQAFQQEQSAQRKSLVGSGDRSERIRTYNFPQGRITDHRINLTEYKLEQVLNGALEIIIDPLNQEHTAELMAQIEE